MFSLRSRQLFVGRVLLWLLLFNCNWCCLIWIRNNILGFMCRCRWIDFISIRTLFYTCLCMVCFFFISNNCCFSRIFKRRNFELTHRHCVSQCWLQSRRVFFYKVKVSRDQCVGGDNLDKVKKIYWFYFGGVYVCVCVDLIGSKSTRFIFDFTKIHKRRMHTIKNYMWNGQFKKQKRKKKKEIE